MEDRKKTQLRQKFYNSKYANNFDLLDVYRTDRTYFVVRCKKCGEISPRRFERINICSNSSPCTKEKKTVTHIKQWQNKTPEQKELQIKKQKQTLKKFYKNETSEHKNNRKIKQQIGLREMHKQRNTWNFKTTKDEDYVYLKLKTKYKNIKQNYKTDKYPYYCDFYIADIDTYIELNISPFHGFCKFTGNKKQLKSLDIYKNKHTKYWDRVIYVWTILDVEKRNMALQNKLKYYEFYTIKDFDEWFILQ